MEANDIVGMVGGLFGIIALGWRLIEALLSHLTISLEIEGAEVPTARITVANSGNLPKRIDYAALLFLREDRSLADISAALTAQAGGRPADDAAPPLSAIHERRPDTPIYDAKGEVGIVPLPFLHDEQMQIGNEVVQCRELIPAEIRAAEGVFVVRLVIFVKYSFGIVRWRQTSDLYIGS